MKKERFNIMLTPSVIRILDKQAKFLRLSRSELILEILSDYIIENNLVFTSSEEGAQVPGQLEVL